MLAFALIAITLAVVYFVSDKNQYHNTDCAQTAYEIFLDDIGIPATNAEDGDATKQKKQEYFDNIATCSDLTAQWRMSVVTERAFYIGLVGIFLIFVTWLATREAVIAARDTAKQELRAYVRVKGLWMTLPEDGRNEFNIVIDLINGGQTPANRAEINWNLRIAEVSANDKRSSAYERSRSGFYGAIGGGGEKTTVGTLKTSTAAQVEELVGRIIDGKDVIEIEGWVEYFDIYKIQRATFFSAQITDILGNKTDFHLTQDGNEMT